VLSKTVDTAVEHLVKDETVMTEKHINEDAARMAAAVVDAIPNPTDGAKGGKGSGAKTKAANSTSSEAKVRQNKQMKGAYTIDEMRLVERELPVACGALLLKYRVPKKLDCKKGATIHDFSSVLEIKMHKKECDIKKPSLSVFNKEVEKQLDQMYRECGGSGGTHLKTNVGESIAQRIKWYNWKSAQKILEKKKKQAEKVMKSAQKKLEKKRKLAQRLKAKLAKAAQHKRKELAEKKKKLQEYLHKKTQKIVEGKEKAKAKVLKVKDQALEMVAGLLYWKDLFQSLMRAMAIIRQSVCPVALHTNLQSSPFNLTRTKKYPLRFGSLDASISVTVGWNVPLSGGEPAFLQASSECSYQVDHCIAGEDLQSSIKRLPQCLAVQKVAAMWYGWCSGVAAFRLAQVAYRYHRTKKFKPSFSAVKKEAMDLISSLLPKQIKPWLSQLQPMIKSLLSSKEETDFAAHTWRLGGSWGCHGKSNTPRGAMRHCQVDREPQWTWKKGFMICKATHSPRSHSMSFAQMQCE